MAETKKRPLSLYILMLLVIFQGLSGIYGGIGLIADPSGKTLQIPIEWLEGSPFADYLFPGLILLVILGFYPLVVLYGLWKNLLWSWAGSLILALALIIWLGVEIIIIGYQTEPPLQLIYGIVGLLILLFTLIPGVKEHFVKI